MALKQVLVLLAALCTVLGRPAEMNDPLLKSSGTSESSKGDPESEQVGAASAMNYYSLGRPMAFIPVYYMPPPGIGAKLKMRRPMQKEGESAPTMVDSKPKISQNMEPEKELPFRSGQKNLEGQQAIPSSMIAQPVQSTKNLEKSMGSLDNMEGQQSRKDVPVINSESSSAVLPSGSDNPMSSVSQQAIAHPSSMDLQSAHAPLIEGKSMESSGSLDQQKIQDREPLMNPQSSWPDSQAGMSTKMDMPMTRNMNQPDIMAGQEDLVPSSEPSSLAIPRSKRSPQFRGQPPYGYDGYDGFGYGGFDGYGGYGGYGGYPGHPGYGPNGYPFYGDEIIDVDIRLI